MKILYRLVTMEFIACLFFAGFAAIASGQAAPSMGFGQNDVMYIDPLMNQRCAKKGINVQDASAVMAECVKTATVNHITSSGGLSSASEAMTIVCRIREPMKPCMEGFLETVKKCYDTEAEKEEIEKGLGVMEASFDYICRNDGQELKDLYSNMEGAMNCMSKMADTDRSLKCMTKVTEHVHPSEMHLQNEETCLAVFEAGRCAIEPLKSCDSMKFYNFLRGIMDATLGASQCNKYVGHLLSAASAPFFSFWMLLGVLFAYAFSKY